MLYRTNSSESRRGRTSKRLETLSTADGSRKMYLDSFMINVVGGKGWEGGLLCMHGDGFATAFALGNSYLSLPISL